MRMQVTTSRDGPTYVDWDQYLINFRKPRTLKPGTESSYKFVQTKFDGNRTLIAKDPAGELRAFTTLGHDISHQLEHLDWWGQCNRLKCKEWLDGEIFIPDSGREEVKSALADRWDCLKFSAFGCSYFRDDEDFVFFIEHIFYCFPGLIPTAQCAPHCVHSLVRQPHFDGLVYKDSMYGRWAKSKFKQTIDLVVLGIKPGNGKYYGMCGALICGIGDRVIANVSGMDDAIREAISDKDVGRVVEVTYERVGSGGKLQHPRFFDWRDDKPASECTLEQDPALTQ